jgi:hypothetical protein
MTETNKIWNTIATFSTFEEAHAKRNEISDNHTAVKVRCCGKYRKSFKVKAWDQPVEKPKKKGKKNVNKKVRSGQKG